VRIGSEVVGFIWLWVERRVDMWVGQPGVEWPGEVRMGWFG
jgi:hypothetical protein